MLDQRHGIFTQAIHAGESPDPHTGAVAPPIHQSTTYYFSNAEEAAAVFAGQRSGYVYTRWGNPTQAALEAKLAALEGGEAALVTASGMAAIATALLTLVRTGDHIVASRGLYSGTHNLMTRELARLGIETTLVDASDLYPIRRALRPNTRLIYIETPANPRLNLVDIAGTVEIACEAGAMTFIDNTFATPINQRPLEMGIDVVVHSATKYLTGHGDAVAGAVIGPADFIRQAREESLRDMGGVISPFNAWLVLRGIHTLPLRMERHNANALHIARWLEEHPKIERVYYPGLPSHPQYELARRQMRGFGGMIAFEVRGGVDAGRALMNGVRLCTLAVSLGDTRTLITHPASTTHSTVSREAREAAGISDGLVRFSVGLEDPEDIIADLDLALAKI